MLCRGLGAAVGAAPLNIGCSIGLAATPDGSLSGLHVVAIDSPMAVDNGHEPLWKTLHPETVRKVTTLESIFDEGRHATSYRAVIGICARGVVHHRRTACQKR